MGEALRTSTAKAIVGAAIALTGSASAQCGGVFGCDPTKGLRPVDPGYADVSALSNSLKVPAIDLRQPTDFTGVYHAPEHIGDNMFVRFSGGIAAVFHKSEYIDVGGVGVPVVAPGTQYYIGGLPPAPKPYRPTEVARHHMVDLAVTPDRGTSRRHEEREEIDLDHATPVSGSIFENELHRRARLSALLSG